MSERYTLNPRRFYYRCDRCGKMMRATNGFIGKLARVMGTKHGPLCHVGRSGNKCGVWNLVAPKVTRQGERPGE